MDIIDYRITKETYLRVENGTFTDIISTHVPRDSLDEFDWDTGDSRPDKNFNNQKIKAGESLTKREEVRWIASNSPFTMILYFADGTEDTFRLQQKHAVLGLTPLKFRFMNNDHDLKAWRVGSTIHVRVENTKAQKDNRLAEDKDKQAQLLIDQKRHEDALKLYREALHFVSDASTKEEISNNLARAHHQIGEKLMLKAKDSQKQEKSEEADKLYEEAKNHFEEAKKLKNTEKYVKGVKAISLKIKGKQIFNEAIKIKREATALTGNEKMGDQHIPATFEEAKKKYKEVLIKLQEALKHFEEGLGIDGDKFGSDVSFTRFMMEAVNDAIFQINETLKQHGEEKDEDTEAK